MPESPAPAPAGFEKRRRKRRGPLGLVCVSVLASLALLVLLEGGLRGVGLGDLPPGRDSKLAYQQVYPPLLAPGTRPDGSAALITNDARVPWQALSDPKPASAFRVVAVGGSATAGLGFSPNVSFPRELERMLRAALPERDVEVLNLGIVALSSSQVRWIVDDACRRLQPDVVVVYSGNNEFLEVHAAKFAAQRDGAGVLARAVGGLRDTNLFRLVSGVRAQAERGRDTTIDDMASAQARVSETEIMREVRLSDDEHVAVVDAYERNLRAMVEVARATHTPLLLSTVAANWQWQGRTDLPSGWVASLLETHGVAKERLGADPFGEALPLIDAELSAAPDHERHDWLFKRGVVLSHQAELNDPSKWPAACDALRAACNEDPRQRRATDELAQRVRAVAADTGAPLLDAVERLAALSPGGVLGDALFYDYVHFTPRGCVLYAAEVFDALVAQQLVVPNPGFLRDAHIQARLTHYASLRSDPLEIGEWLGIGDLARVHDRELWKHQLHVRALDERLALDPDDLDALLRRGNAWFFARDGFTHAEAAYTHVLELQPGHLAAALNLAKLRGARRP